MFGVCDVLLVCKLSSAFPCKLCLCHPWHYSQITLLLTKKKPHHSLVLQEHPNSGTFAANILQEIIHFYVIIHLENIAKHDRNENHVKETKGMYSVSSNTMRSEQRDEG